MHSTRMLRRFERTHRFIVEGWHCCTAQTKGNVSLEARAAVAYPAIPCYTE